MIPRIAKNPLSTQEKSRRLTTGTRFLASASAIALLTAGFVGTTFAASVHENRNFDARGEINALAAAQPAAAQLQAVDNLRKQVPELASEFDSVMGTTRSIYNRMGYLTDSISGTPMDAAMGYIRSNLDVLGLSAEDLGEYEVTDSVFSKVTGATHIYLRQKYDGIPVYNGQLHININRDGKIISVNNAFVRNIAQAVNSPEPLIGAGDAVASLTQHLGITENGLIANDASAELFWLPVRDGDVRLVWNFQRETADFDHHYDVTVDARTGDVMTRFDWTNSGTYVVYKEPDESPLHGTTGRQTVVDPEDGTASPNGWFTGGTMGGNNVLACPDISPANNVCDSNPQCSGTTCNFPINLNNQPSTFIPAATANLFYWNNLIHDIQYQYGFDEPGGNFQENNFGRGGNGSDRVNADVQDGSGNCNANMSTPTDGGNPRMQMFTCNRANPDRDGDLDNAVIVHEYGHGISIRQVGGPGNSSCLNNTQQAGEGWSDWWGLVYTAETGDAGTDTRGIGTYLFGEGPNGPGIRDLPYSTNNSVNNWTYNSIGGASIPHGVGSRWAQAAWEVYWALVDKHGFSAGDDLIDPSAGGGFSGSQRAMLYVNEGLKNTACGPTFINNRDGIIQAATDNFGGEDVCTIWEAFAAFGLGTNASTSGPGSRNATNGFNIPAACACSPQATANAGPNQTITAGQSVTIGTPGLAGHTYSWSPGGATTAQITVSPGSTTTYTVTATTTCGSSSDSVTVTVAGPSGCPAGTSLLHEASFDSNANGWTNNAASTCSTGDFVQGTPTEIINGGVTTQVGGNASGAGSWFSATNSGAGTNDVDGGTCDTRSPGAAAAAGNVNISFDYFHGQRDAGDDANDGFVVDVLSNGSVVGTLISIGDVTSNAVWTPFTGNVNLTSAGSVQLRVRAIDATGGGDLVEAGIDNVQICGTPDDGPPPGGCTVDDDFEAGAPAWNNDGASTCSTGAYVVGNPTQQVNGGVTTQVGGSNSGTNSIFTATNTSAGNADVDGGNCILTSPNWNVTAASTLSVAYFHGQRDAGDDASGDFFRLEYSTDGGSTFSTLVSNGDSTSNAAWNTATTAIPGGSNVQLRVQCSDGSGPGDLVECGIDDVSICDN